MHHGTLQVQAQSYAVCCSVIYNKATQEYLFRAENQVREAQIIRHPHDKWIPNIALIGNFTLDISHCGRLN